LNGEIPSSERAILNEIRKAHYKKVLGENPDAEAQVLNILNELEFDEHMDTEQIVLRMNEIIKKHFKFRAGSYEVSLKQYIEKKKTTPTVPAEEKEEKTENQGYSLMKNLVVESAETTRDFYFEQDEDNKNINFNIHKLTGKRTNTDRGYIQKYYGVSILPEHKINVLEQSLCTGNHKKARLHITRGEFDESALNDVDAAYNNKVAKEQNESNINYYYDNYARNNNSILNLTNKIRNTMLVNFD